MTNKQEELNLNYRLSGKVEDGQIIITKEDLRLPL